MRSRSIAAVSFAIVLLFSIAAETRAQEGSLPLSVESATNTRSAVARTPMMVVHDAALPVPEPAKPTAPASNAKSKGSPAPAEKPAADPAAPNAIVIPARGSSASEVHSVGTTGKPVYDELIRKSSARYGVDPNLVMAVMRQESGFNPRAMSYKGATGLMQLMPATARRFGVENIYDPAQNIDAGTRYLRFLLDTFNGDVDLALAGYNAGENAVVRYGHQVPPYRETQNYVRSISAKYGKGKNPRAKTVIASTEPIAPAAISIGGGTSTRFSNNY
jgi:soluble lytic murein transglycosylase-like protein